MRFTARGELVGHVFLVAEHGEAFFQRELEPVAAGHAVARPVMEIFMRDHALDVLEIRIRRGFGAGQHIGGVEDVEALVLHRPGIEVGHRGDVEHIEVIFQPERLLVPAHRILQRLHGVAAARLVAALHPDAEIHVPAGGGGEFILHRHQVGRDQREEIGGFRVRVLPSAQRLAVLLALGQLVAVGEQHGEFFRIRAQRHIIARHHVRAVGEIGDLAEALRLALREEAGARHIQAGEFGVLLRADFHQRFQREFIRRVVHGQPVFVQRVAVIAERLAVQR